MEPLITPGIAIAAGSFLLSAARFYLSHRRISTSNEIRNFYYEVIDKKQIRHDFGEEEFNTLTDYLATISSVVKHVERKLKRDFVMVLSVLLILFSGYIANPGALLAAQGFKYLGVDGIILLTIMVLVSSAYWIKSKNTHEYRLINNAARVEQFLYQKYILPKIKKLNAELEELPAVRTVEHDEQEDIEQYKKILHVMLQKGLAKPDEKQ